jgi:hypothetical protein
VLICVRAGVALSGVALSEADGVPTDALGRSEFFAAWAAAGRLTWPRVRVLDGESARSGVPFSLVPADRVESGAAGSAEATAVETADPAPATIPATATPRHICLTFFMNWTVVARVGLSSPNQR